jgi:hypothetical protein
MDQEEQHIERGTALAGLQLREHAGGDAGVRRQLDQGRLAVSPSAASACVMVPCPLR